MPTHTPTTIIITILKPNNYEVLTVLKVLLRALHALTFNFPTTLWGCLSSTVQMGKLRQSNLLHVIINYRLQVKILNLYLFLYLWTCLNKIHWIQWNLFKPFSIQNNKISCLWRYITLQNDAIHEKVQVHVDFSLPDPAILFLVLHFSYSLVFLPSNETLIR